MCCFGIFRSMYTLQCYFGFRFISFRKPRIIYLSMTFSVGAMLNLFCQSSETFCNSVSEPQKSIFKVKGFSSLIRHLKNQGTLSIQKFSSLNTFLTPFLYPRLFSYSDLRNAPYTMIFMVLRPNCKKSLTISSILTSFPSFQFFSVSVGWFLKVCLIF